VCGLCPVLVGRLLFTTLVANDFLVLVHATIFLQESAQASQAATHSSISPTRLQSFAHSAQISAHSLQACLWWGVLMSMKCAEVLQISAQAIMRRK
jgi:hypothetical protein